MRSLVGSRQIDSLKRQRFVFTLLNLFLLVLLLVLHEGFASFWGKPAPAVVALLGITSAARVAELFWLHRNTLDARASAYITLASVCINLAVAVLLASVIDREDSQYFALLVVPILEMAFRFGLAPTLAVVGCADLVCFYWVWRYGATHPPVEIGEYFEAGTISIIFLIVAVLVSVLVRQIGRNEAQLRTNLVELQRTKSRLLQETKLAAIGRLSSAVAHEIRNPVTMISASLATAKSVAGAEREEMYEIASKEAARLTALTNEFLAYAKPRAASISEGNLADTVRYVCRACRALAGEKSVLLQLDMPSELFGLYDPGMTEQALMNILKNAIEASPAGGTVRIRAAVHGRDAIQIDVENEGGPIPESAAARLFEPFVTTKAAGTGLGLATAHGLVRAQQGELVLTRNDATSVCFSIMFVLGAARSKAARTG